LLLLALIGEITIEAMSRVAYSRSLTALQARIAADKAAGQRTTSVQADSLISGWPARSEREAAGVKTIEYHWPSFLWDLRIQLARNADGNVQDLTLGRNALAPPKGSGSALAGAFPGPAPGERVLRGLSPRSTPLVALDLTHTGIAFVSAEHGHLLRELVRQALLIAARDELGLPTRDRLLGEPLPDDENATLPVLGISTSINKERLVEIVVSSECRDGYESELSLHRFQLPPGPLIQRLAARADALSAGEFPGALRKAGFAGRAHPYRAEGPIGEDIDLWLQGYDAHSQLAGIRLLHTQIAELGESPERLAALAGAYARMGTLTRFLWSPAHKVFAARGLIYAERLMRRTSGGALALWTRGYVRALVGLHSTALDDFAAARASDRDAAAPDWASPVEALCRGDLAQLDDLATDVLYTSLASYLHFLGAAPSATMNVRLKTAARLLGAEPDCFMAMDVMADHAPLGVRRQMDETAFAHYAEALRRHLAATADAPEEARRAAAEELDDLPSIMAARARVLEALRAADAAGGARAEPSFAVLASLIEETTFVHAVRLLALEAEALAVDTGKDLAALKPLFGKHPFAAFIDSFDNDQDVRLRELTRLIATIDRDYVELSAGKIFEYYSPNGIAQAGDATVGRCDRIYADLAQTLAIRCSDRVKHEAALALSEVSPGSPLAVAALIVHDWERAEPSAAAWEKNYKRDAAVIGALAEKYTTLKRFDDAVRCRTRQLEIEPDQEAFRALAALYWEHGDEQLWFETLTRSLEAPSFGLEHAHSHTDLAYYHMRRGEWDEARPHADGAAASYSGWGLLCAAEFYERTGNWRKAETFHRLTAERYEISEFDWYRWCRRTGRGNLAAARRLAEKCIARQRKNPTAEGLDTIGMYEALEDQPARALEEFRAAAAREGGNAYHALHAALLADELGNPPLRDELLVEARRRGATENGYLVVMISAFERCLEQGIEQFDRAYVDWAIRDRSRPGSPTNEFYFVGKFLALRGRESEAREYFQSAATSSHYNKFNSTLAAYALLKSGVAIGPRRDAEFDDATTALIDRIQKAGELDDAGDWDKALAALSALIDEHPDFPDAWYHRGSRLMRHDELERALGDLTRAHELIPGCPQFLATRGQVLEYLGRYDEAADDYKTALERDPRHALSRYNLAFLRAACPDAAARDARAAQEQSRKVLELPEIQRFLALALVAAAEAEAGNFDEAARQQADALKFAPADTQETFKERLELYRRREPYHRKPQWWKQR
jgi:tetratricopeptide (TPR) repeat protein